MLNASVGVQRVLGRVRRTSIDSMIAFPQLTRPRVTARVSRPRYGYLASSRHLYPLPRRRRRTFVLPSLTLYRPSLRVSSFRASSLRASSFSVSFSAASAREAIRLFPHLMRRLMLGIGHERIVAIAAAGILLTASFMSVTPGGPRGDTGGPSGDGPGPRLAVAGSIDDDGVASVEEDYVTDAPHETEGGAVGSIAHPDLEPVVDRYAITDVDALNRAGIAAALASAATKVDGPFLEDGTLLKPVAVDTKVEDGSDLLRSYKVKSGDTLSTIANRFDIEMMTLWWANKLEAKDQLHIGQQLRIPPVNGLVVTVTPADTLTSLATKFKVNEQEILTTNELDDRNLVVGQVLVLPGARGAKIKEPKARKHSTSLVSRPSRPRTGGGSVRPPARYNGGSMAWPTSSHHISQYFHYGHYGIDIDGSTGDPDLLRRGRDGDLRRLEEQRWRVPGVGRPRLRSVHDVQPHVGRLGRARPKRRARPASRPDGRDRFRDRLAPPLRGVARPHLGRRDPDQPARVPVVADGPVGPLSEDLGPARARSHTSKPGKRPDPTASSAFGTSHVPSDRRKARRALE